jgi:hypothetical protein
MYARSTTVTGTPGSIDAGITYVRDVVMPMVQGLPGWVGLSMLCDRESGRCVITTSWKTQDAMRTSAPMLRATRSRAGQILGDPSHEVREWEVAIMHRLHPTGQGACTRVTWTRTDPTRVGDAIDAYRMGVLPEIEAWAGFCSVSMMVDRDEGTAVTAVTYDDRASMEASRQPAAGLRNRFSGEVSVELLDVAEFELVLAHLRVPEMA